MVTESNSKPGNLLLAFIRSEISWLLGLALLFHLLAQVHWDKTWKDFPYDAVLRWYVPLVFILAAAYAGLARLPEIWITYKLRIHPRTFIELLGGYLAVAFIRNLYPVNYVDDAGFILRYFDNFAEGCFFCFNVEDGPVFGLSSFGYGIIGGAISWTGILSSTATMNLLTYAGTFFTAFLIFRILREVLKSPGLVALAWVLVMTSNRSMAIIYNSGMEAPVHFSIVLAAILFFLQRRERLMWLFMAFAAISKLDAVPLVVTLAAFWAVENREDLLRFDWHKQRYREAFLYGLVPVLLWILFAWIVFGSPMPQSAYAKLHYMPHAKGSWFPFLEGFVENGFHSLFFAGACVLFLLQVGWVAAKREGGRSLVFGTAFLGTMLLYYLYNPGERMQWYYVLPEGLMLMTLAAGLQWLGDRMPGQGRLVVAGLVVGAAGMFTWTNLWGEMMWADTFRSVVEGERKAIGKYLETKVPEGDTLHASHGLIGWPIDGYVLDETGLNFKKDTTSKHRNEAFWARYRSNWVAMHGHNWEVDKLNAYPYALDTSFFEICTYGLPAWRIFKRTPTIDESSGTYFINANVDVIGDQMEVFPEPGGFCHVKANAFTFVRQNYNKREEKITLALIRHDADYEVHIRDVFPGDTTLWEKTVTVKHRFEPGTTRLMPLTIPLIRRNVPANLPAGPRYIILTFTNSFGKVGLYDPAISILRRDP